MHTLGAIAIYDGRGVSDEVDFANRPNGGSVLNIGRKANKKQPAKFHRNSCRYVNSRRVAKGGFTSGEFYKAHSQDSLTFKAWALGMHQIGEFGEPSDCKYCRPGILPI